MKKNILAILLLAALPGAKAQSIDSLFVNAPAEVMPLLDSTTRLNLLDLYEAWGTAQATNELGGTSQLTSKDSLMLELAPTEGSTWTMARLDSAMLACIHTLRLPASDSRLTFYDTQWRPLPVALPALTLSDFLVPADSLGADRRRELTARLRPLHICWTLEPDGATFRAAAATDGLVSADREEAETLLRPLHFRLDGSALRPTGAPSPAPASGE